MKELPYRAIVENSLDAIALIRRDSTTMYASPSVSRVLGYAPEEFLEKSVFDFVHPDDLERSRALFARALESAGAPMSAEVRCRHRDGSWRQIEVFGVNRLDDPEVGALVVNYRDVTQRKDAEDRLRESEKRYRLLFERNLAGVYRATVDGRILECNDTFARIYGYGSPEELESLDALELCFSEKDWKGFVGGLRRKGALLNHELRGRRKDGSAIWLLENVRLCPPSEDEPEVIEGTRLDITERKEIEEKLRSSRERLRRLSQRVQGAREDERTRIAREIHDELGQRLTALKMSVSRLRKGLAPDSERLRTDWKAILESIDSLLRTVRDLSTELRPAVLDHLDLDDAVKWQARDFESKTGIRCEVISRLDGRPIGSRRTTDLFRVVQEALTNVVRHARASRVQIEIVPEAGDLLLEVADNGQGISDDDLNRPASLGLLGIRERIQALGGDVQLVSQPGKGTRVRVRVPLRRRGEDHEEDPDRR